MLFTILMLPVFAAAAPIACTTSPSTLSYYINTVNANGGCAVDELTFSNFSFSAAAGQTSNPTEDEILITPIDGDETTDPGLTFSHTSGVFALGGPNLSMEFTITFMVTAADPHLLYAASLFSTFNQTSSGNTATVHESVTHEAGKAQMTVTQGQNGPQVRFFPLDQSITVEKTWSLKTGGNALSTVSVGDVHQNFTATPEPLTLVLTGIPLLGMGIARRFRR
jgi:hypothetical protein